jgi:asparagine synthase (glutamine-hydrolysing)
MRVRDGHIERMWRLYDLPYDQQIRPSSVENAVDEVRAYLVQAVRRQMVADMPVGAFLSGGLDSSAVVAMARDYASTGRLPCFTFGITDDAVRKEGIVHDLPYVQRVAKHVGVDLCAIYVGPHLVDDHLREMIYHLDEPLADPAPLNVLFISRFARALGIKVLLSGAARDDLFSGYRRHYLLLRENYFTALPHSAIRLSVRCADHPPRSSPVTRRIGRMLRYACLEVDAPIASHVFWIDPNRLRLPCGALLARELATSDSASPLLSYRQNLPARVEPLKRTLYLGAKHFLADHNLNDTGKLSMAAGVEAGAALLDSNLESRAARLSLKFKQHGRTRKWMFKKAMEDIAPQDAIDCPKTGFGALLRWGLKHDLRHVIVDVLFQWTLKNRGVFNPGAVRALIDDERAGRINAVYPICAPMCVELCCRPNFDRNVTLPELAARREFNPGSVDLGINRPLALAGYV